MATHFLGPVLNREVNDHPRGWFSNLPISGNTDITQYFNDFLFAGSYAAADWVVTETQAGATQGIAADVLGGALALVNSAADNDVNQLQSAEEWVKLSSGKRAWFEIRLKCSEATETDWYVGFATTDTTIIAGTTDSCGFRKDDGATNIYGLTETSTTETATSLGAAAADTFVTLGFVWDGKNAVRFYLNRALKATHTTNVPSSNQLALTIMQQNGDANARTLTVDYVYVAMER